MSGKRVLATLLGNEAVKPALRRGQGVRLSTDMPNDGSKRADAQTHERDDASTHQRISAKTAPVRVNRGYKLREDLIKACKRIALEEDRHLYEVMEEALAAYLAGRGPG